MNTITCQTCGDTYDISHTRGRDRKNRLFCGKKCSARFTNVVYPRRGESTITPVRDDTGRYLECVGCSTDISTETHKAFCTDGCREDFWFKVTSNRPPEHKTAGNECPHCGKSIGNASKTCVSCMYIDRCQERVDTWLAGEWNGARPGNEYQLADVIRRFLLKKANYACTRCGFDTPHSTGSSILQVEHIDGHANNHRPENLTVLCPNCHALTETYGARNVGNGRPFKRTSVILSRI